VLALDLSSHVGFAYGHLDCTMPHFGTWHLPQKGGEGGRFAAFENVLADTMDQFGPSSLLIEKHLPLPALNNTPAARQQFGLRAFCYAEAWRASVPVSEIDAQYLRYALMGQRLSRDIAKREVMQYCRKRGWKVLDDHSADACLLWEWHRRQMNGGRPVAGPLWRDAI
jgi:hypothetical protein